MGKPLQHSPDRLFDAPWRPGHPWHRRRSGLRTVAMAMLLLLLCALIGGYVYITDQARVRGMAQDLLSDLVGGRVEIERATLSLFEGVSLGNVRVYVDHSGALDSLLFSADVILVKYDPRVLIRGRLAADQIIAIDPHVHLTQNVDTGIWNYQRLRRPAVAPNPVAAAGGPALALPEVLLRSAEIDHSQVRGGEFQELGTLAVEAQLMPSADGQRYQFELQTRGESTRVGARISGWMARGGGEYSARLEGFEFGRDVMAVLPTEARTYLSDHELSGRVNVVDVSYAPHQPGRPTEFRAEIDLERVTLIVRPQEWMSREDLARRASMRLAFTMMARLSNPLRKISEPRDPLRDSDPPAHRPPERDPFRLILASFDLVPLQLESVAGRILFTQDGVQIRRLRGRVADHALIIDGAIDGYSPLAPAWLRVASDPQEHLEMKSNPSYLRSLPRPVRRLHQHLRPQGLCDVLVELKRERSGARPAVSGYVNVVDGSFVFDRFAYPVRKASGRISFGTDPASGETVLMIEQLRGFGVADGPNANSPVVLNGRIAPLGPDAGVNVTVSGQDISSEAALTAAFPDSVRQALRIFDHPDGRSEGPEFFGDFECQIERPPGPWKPWFVTTDISIKRAAGRLRVFPYPLEQVSGRLTIRDDYLDIAELKMVRGDASVTASGRVRWKDDRDLANPHVYRPILIRPDLAIAARNVPMDDDLLAAMQPVQRQWVRRLGVSGKLDFDGRVYRREDVPPDAPMARAIAHSFDVALHDGAAWPAEGDPAISGLSARMQLTPDRLVINDAAGQRGRALLSGHGTVDWADGRGQVSLVANATDLLLEPSLYRILPRGVQHAWDQVQPEGSIDLSLSYSGRTAAVEAADTQAADEPTTRDAPQLSVTIRPRELAATVRAVPYRLDGIRGSILVSGQNLTLSEMTGRHGASTIKLQGVGSMGENGQWDLQLAAENLAVDEDLKQALPEALASLAESTDFSGDLSLSIKRLQLRGELGPPPATATAPADGASSDTTSPAEQSDLDVDFDVELSTQGASANLGVPVTQLNAQGAISGTVRVGRLDTLSGSFQAPSAVVAGRPASGFAGQLNKRSGEPAIQVAPLSGTLAGGEVAGQIELATPADGPSRYAMRLVLRDADVKQIAGEVEQEVTGRLTASLAMEGNWADPSQRRGRGEVSVSGREMYKIPLVLGLLQITNLALPVTRPFEQASVAYAVDGQRVTFEQIVLRSRDLLMEGSGDLDFDSRAVRMTFTTDNPNLPSVPVIGPLMETAKREMVQIRVRGTLQEPRVTATGAATFTTTVDEVLGGDAR